MRKALLVVTLVAASFAGGAAVNGPGLKWVKALISSRLRQGPPIPTVEVDSEPPGVTSTEKPPAPVIDDVPSAPAAPLIPDALAAASTTGPEPTTPLPAAPTEAPALVAEPPSEVKEPAAPVLLPVDPPKPKPEPAKTGGWADAPGPAPSTAVLPTPKDQPGPTSDAAVAAASAAAPPLTLADPATADTTGGWAAIRKRMRAMGVKKYWVEGTPSGVVTFRCVVPVPGQESVSQQFEAEGDDDLEAAEVALRRASLWQATQRLKD